MAKKGTIIAQWVRELPFQDFEGTPMTLIRRYAVRADGAVVTQQTTVLPSGRRQSSGWKLAHRPVWGGTRRTAGEVVALVNRWLQQPPWRGERV